MPKLAQKSPDELRPYLSHGVELEWRDGDKDASGTCPWCGREGKFGVRVETGVWRCFVCGEGNERGGGNVYTFLRKLWEISDRATTDYAELASDRGLLEPETLMRWGVCISTLSNLWLVPAYSADGSLCQLYQWKMNEREGRRFLQPTPTMGHGLHTIGKPSGSAVYVCEGIWDAMVLWEVLRRCKETMEGLTTTANEDSSLLADASVVAVPSCGAVGEPFKRWLPVFAGKRVILLFDSDHPRTQKSGSVAQGAGQAASQRAARLLSEAKNPPEEILWLRWGPEGYDPSLKSGYDVRDCLCRGSTLAERVGFLGEMLSKVERVPEEWLAARARDPVSKGRTLSVLECSSYEEMIEAWKKALYWRQDIQDVLSVMLAVSLSTAQVGDQLFLQVIGEAGCLHGDTPIYDPVDATTETVELRWKAGKSFHVVSVLTGEDVGIVEASKPIRFPEENFYHVTFKSGRSIVTTAAHRFYTGNGSYVSVKDVLLGFSSCRLPSISESCLSALMQDGLRSMRTTQDSPVDYRSRCHSCGEPPRLAQGICQASFPLPNDCEEIVKVEKAGRGHYYDFHVPGTENYWAEGVFHHNSAKTRLCDALLVSNQCFALEHLTGFHSGWKDESGEDFSLLSRINYKTLITPEGDVLMSSPRFIEIMSQQRRIFDGTSGATYKNRKEDIRYTGLRTPWIMAGTPSLMDTDQSRLGDRFLRVCIGRPSPAERQKILEIVGATALRSVLLTSDGDASSHIDEDMCRAYRLTGGYVNHMRSGARDLIGSLVVDEEKVLSRCAALAEFTADYRARPDRRPDAEHGAAKEQPTRLMHQYVRLACCLGVVLQRKTVDEEVLRVVKKVALDTSQGKTLSLASHLYAAGESGTDPDSLASLSATTGERARTLLRFMKQIGVAESFKAEVKGLTARVRWRLTKRAYALYTEVMDG